MARQTPQDSIAFLLMRKVADLSASVSSPNMAYALQQRQGLPRNLLRTFDWSQVPPSWNYREGRAENRFVQLLRHCYRRGVVLFTHDHRDRHTQRRQKMPRVSVAKHYACRGIAIQIVGQKYLSHCFN